MEKKTKVEFEFVPLDQRLKSSLRETQKVAEDTEKAANKSVISIGQIAGAIVGAGALQKIKGFFNEAFEASNRLEASMMRVNALARVTGQDAAKAQAAVQAESKRGILSLTENAQAFADAMSLGLSVDQAKQFITALEDIASVQRTMGTTAEAVTSGIAGLVSGSTERVENIGNSVKKLNMQFTQNKQTMTESAAIQQLYNGVIKEGAKFQGDAARQADTAAGAQKRYNAAIDEAKAAIGEGLKPAYKALYEALIPVIEAFTNWFSGLGESTKLVVSFGAALTLMVPAIGALIPLLGALSIAMGPITLIAAAVAGITALLALAMEEARKANTTPLANEYNSLVAKQQENARLLTEKEKERLSYLEKLVDKNGGVLARMQMQNQTLQQQEQYLRSINALEEQRTKMSSEVREKLKQASKQDLENIRKMYLAEQKAAPKLKGGEIFTAKQTGLDRSDLALGREETYYYGDLEISQKASEAQVAQIEAANRAAVKERKSLEALNRLGISPELLKKSGADILKEIESIIGQATVVAKNPAKYFGLALREELREIAQGYYSFIAQTQGQIAKLEAERKKSVTDSRRAELSAQIQSLKTQADEANRIRAQQEETAKNARRQQLAEYIEDQATAEKIKNEQDYINARIALEERKKFDVRYSQEAAEEKLTIEQKYQKDLENLSAQRRKRDEIADLQAANRVLQGASVFSSGLAGAIGAKSAGQGLTGTGQLMSGLGQISNQLSPLKEFGAAFGVLGSITNVFTGLFEKSDEERQREAKEQARRDEEARVLLELSANYQRSMLALQEAAAKLPFENLTRKLRLIEIQTQEKRLAGQDESSIQSERLSARQSAIQETLTTQSGSIAGGTLFVDVQATPESLIQFLSQRAAEATAIQQFVQLFGSFSSLAQGSGRDAWLNYLNQYQTLRSQIYSYQGKVPDALFNAAVSAFSAADEELLIKGGKSYYDGSRFQIGRAGSVSEAVAYIQSMNGAGQAISAGYSNQLYAARAGAFSGSLSSLYGLQSEVTSDTTIAENLLSVIEQGYQAQLDIAANTKKTADNTSLQLEKDRAAAFIDIAGGGIRGFGQLLTGQYGLNTNALTLPQGLSNAILATQGMKTLEEKSFDALKSILGVNEDMRELLAEIAVNTNRAAGTEVIGSRSETELLQMLDAFKARS